MQSSSYRTASDSDRPGYAVVPTAGVRAVLRLSSRDDCVPRPVAIARGSVTPRAISVSMEAQVAPPTSIIERTLSAEIKLYYDLHLPQQTPAPLLIALHGYGASKRQMMREAQNLAPEEFAIVSLQGPHQHLKEAKEPGGPLRFGFGWLTNFRPEESIAIHQRALLEVTDSLVKEGVADPKRVFLLGFSQSCALNYRFA